MIRRLLALALSGLVTACLFWIMHYLILSGGGELEEAASYKTIDFVRVPQEERLETRERSRPEPPSPEKPPPPPPQLQVQPAAVQPAAIPVGLPDVSIPTSITGGPTLGQNAGLIPLVRLTPQYPRQAARAGISGWVKLRIVVNPDGSVREARAIDADPRGLFEAAAVAAALRGRFRPRVVDGVAVESSGEYTVNFSLGTN